MPQPSRPRKGSLGFGPRKRATSEVPRFRSWPDDDGQPTLQGFAGYKAGMSHVVMINDEADSPREGMEETVPVTIVETPPMRAVALRAYEDTPYGKTPLTEIWADEFHDELDRTLDLPEDHDRDAAESEIRETLEDGRIADLRMITHTVPEEVKSVPKKKPDVMETRIGGGSLEDRLEYGLDLLEEGGSHAADQIFRPGEYLDVAGVTKGKGFAGTVKRHNFRTQDATHGNSLSHRVPGSIGQNQTPGRVFKGKKMAGHMGDARRTVQNLQVVRVDAERNLLLIRGAVPGSTDGDVIVRPSIKAPGKGGH